MTLKPVKRNRYSSTGIHEIPHESIHHAQDFNEFHLPLAHLHHAHLHDWGVAHGLAVSGDEGATTLTVAPGVALDTAGRLIALSREGRGDIGADPPAGQHTEVPVPVQLSTTAHAGQTVYLTIRFSEILRTSEGSGGRLEQAPWLRLQAASDPVPEIEDGIALVLAIVEVDADGSIAAIKAQDSELPHRRRLVGAALEEVRFRRAGQQEAGVEEILSGRIGPGDGGGLRVTVPEEDDAIVLAREDGGNFGRLNVQADAIGLAGSVGIGTEPPEAGLHIAEDLRVDGTASLGPTTVAGAFQVDGSTTLTVLEVGSAKVDALEVARDLDVGRDVKVGRNLNAQRLNADTASVDRLNVSGNIRTRADLHVDGNVGIGTRSPQAKLSLGRDLGSTKLAVYERGNSAYGFGVTAGRFHIHVGNPNARFCFLDAPGGTEVVTIRGNGRVGLGTISPRWLLHVNGSAAKPGGGSWTNTSDVRLKKNIQPLEGTLDKLLQLRGVSFEWKEPANHGNLTGRQTDMIAQEVERVFPEWVDTDSDGYKDLTFRGFEALTVEAFRELAEKIEVLETKNRELEERIKALEEKLNAA